MFSTFTSVLRWRGPVIFMYRVHSVYAHMFWSFTAERVGHVAPCTKQQNIMYHEILLGACKALHIIVSAQGLTHVVEIIITTLARECQEGSKRAKS